uniref:Transcription and mRNA export factor ENY2 n=1 Tax=Seriola dumerili TaxID=41447 RepID=A0A3B4U3G5_SERDU
MSKESRMRATINQKLTEMGEGERLKELLRAKLTECGWKDQMKAHCKEVIKDKGLEHVTVEDLMVEITPKGREGTEMPFTPLTIASVEGGALTRCCVCSKRFLVPDSVKKELLQRIRAFLAQHAT